MTKSSTSQKAEPQHYRRIRTQGGLLPGRIGTHLRRAECAVFERLQQVLARSLLTPGEFGILLLIFENEGLSQAELAEAIGADRSTVVALLDRFESRDLVVRLPSPLDRRTHALRLTENGHVLMADLIPLVEAHERKLAARLSPLEQAQLIELLSRIAE